MNGKHGYGPNLSTVHLLAEILALPNIGGRILPPTRSRRTMLRLYCGRDGAGERVYSDFTLPEARAFLAAERSRDR